MRNKDAKTQGALPAIELRGFTATIVKGTAHKTSSQDRETDLSRYEQGQARFQRQPGEWLHLTAAERTSALEDFQRFEPIQYLLFQRIIQHLPDVLSGRSHALSLLMEDDLWSKLYRERYVKSDVLLLRNWFELYCHKMPHANIIEVGGGSAASSVSILRKIGGQSGETPWFSRYVFTDISTGWFEDAQKLLEPWQQHVSFEKLEIDQDPTTQGFVKGSFDVVLAVNVLHTTENISRTLKNCHSLLKPGGKLVLGEMMDKDEPTAFIWGTLPGWCSPKMEDKTGRFCRKMNGTARRVTIYDRTRDVSHGLKIRLEASGLSVEPWDIEEAARQCRGKCTICLLELDDPFLAHMDGKGFEHVQKLILNSAELLWVTFVPEPQAETAPFMGLVSGLLRTARTENPQLRLHELHLVGGSNTSPDASTLADLIVQKLREYSQECGAAAGEPEVRHRDGLFQVMRYAPEPQQNEELAQTRSGLVLRPQPLIQPGRPMRLAMQTAGALDSLHFVVDEEASKPLGEQEVEVEHHFCGMNFRDIVVAMGHLPMTGFGCEASGVVTSIGSQVTLLQPGDRVMGAAMDSMRTKCRASETAYHIIPDGLSMADAATIPVVHMTAYRCLVDVARLSKGESVLVHAAAGGLGLACIQLATYLGANIYCTVGRKAKKELMLELGIPESNIFSSRDLSFAGGIMRQTKQRGVDVIVNSLTGEALRQTWECIAPFGRFLEVGKRDVYDNTGLEMSRFLKNVQFSCVDIAQLGADDPVSYQRLLRRVVELLNEGHLRPIRPLTTFDMTDVETAFRKMQQGKHMGKQVLGITSESRVTAPAARTASLVLDPDATYLLVGGFGGLGRGLALHIAEHGARNLVLVSRSGPTRPEAQGLLRRLESMAVNVKPISCDIGDQESLAAMIQSLTATMPPLRGVIQGAMALHDKLFCNMTSEEWSQSIRPKAAGSWNLHKLLPKHLDFFLMLSSVSGVIGSASQSNYAAGNAFQDALAHHRRSLGLRANALDLSVIHEMGYVEENRQSFKLGHALDYTGLDSKRLLAVIDTVLSQSSTQTVPAQLVLGLGTGGIERTFKSQAPGDDFWWLRSSPQLSYLLRVDAADSDTATGATNMSSHQERLRSAKSTDEAAELVQSMVVAKLSRIIMRPEADIDRAATMQQYGLDSLVASELRNWLNKELDCHVSILELLDSRSIADLCAKIVLRSSAVAHAGGGKMRI
ncbi:KR domain-containing protein [Hirsutella rhossiliensis]|uniref:KR domain-containing protein n=1 Tax=Hirsutella rhossiliensis TaxID=111463 RepID=A0A9P8MX10_9HYPO|nr:KR domain-containing protein [Hirsutella rhossiliensis]KAH0962739.1 KR domain-containing protein [Hirsutella rhossiliensis]